MVVQLVIGLALVVVMISDVVPHLPTGSHLIHRIELEHGLLEKERIFQTKQVRIACHFL